MSTKPAGYWQRFENMETELRAFIAEYGQAGVMPTQAQLFTHGDYGLAAAILTHGGFLNVARRLHLKRQKPYHPKGYWDDLENVRKEIIAFVGKRKLKGVMPTHAELKQAGRTDLIKAIYAHGTFRSVAEKLGLELSKSRKTKAYWSKPASLKRELLAFITEQGTSGIMPTREMLRTAGRADLDHAITRHGGALEVAQRLNLQILKGEENV